MKLAVAILIGACGSPPKADPGFPNMPVESGKDAGAPADADDEALPFVPIGEGSNSELPPPPREKFKPGGTPASAIAASSCIPAGTYRVSVDLSGAKLSQANTGMDDMTWCKSLLEGVPATTMSRLVIIVEGGQMRVEWPAGKPSTIVSTGTCSFGVTSPPMIATLTFGNTGRASGFTSYQVGTQNHPEESCSAVGAKLTLALDKP
ncbi:MAG: hypothetical protein H0V17_10315 [Deltaproteobacteria bacterium]|nr:hypothetical protein [Deltaproteobacteria bacterium]